VSDILPNDAQDVAKDTRDPETGPYRGAPGRLAGMRSLTKRRPESPADWERALRQRALDLYAPPPGENYNNLLAPVAPLELYVDGVKVPYTKMTVDLPHFLNPLTGLQCLEWPPPGRNVRIRVEQEAGPVLNFSARTVGYTYNTSPPVHRLDISVEGPDVGTPSAQEEEGNRDA
jgi:hypothetical protein